MGDEGRTFASMEEGVCTDRHISCWDSQQIKVLTSNRLPIWLLFNVNKTQLHHLLVPVEDLNMPPYHFWAHGALWLTWQENCPCLCR